MRFGRDVPHPNEHGQMSVPQVEQLDSLDHRDEFRGRALLQAAITEAFALLNAGAHQEAIAQIRQYADLAARSNAGCYIFGLIYFNAGDLRHALTWFDRAVALQPGFPEALSAYEAALQWSPDHCEALTNRGALLERFGRLDEALACFDSIETIRPGDSYKGSVLQKLGRLENAFAAYEK